MDMIIIGLMILSILLSVVSIYVKGMKHGMVRMYDHEYPIVEEE